MTTPLQILAPDGTVRGEPQLSPEAAARAYEAMVTARVYDRKCSAMQRQGRLATYAPFEGQEASQIGSVAALRADDWLVATYRDAAAMWYQGYGMRNLILGRTGDERGGHPEEGVNVLPPSITVGGHMIHAVGAAWAEQIKGSGRIALTLFGDGATSEGDFHEAMNFAAVFATPTVLFCQDNGWAISMPRERQTAAASLADKAIGYGMPGVVVDGNDLFAVHAATSAAAERARSGDGPTFIEALTYRVGPHTTTDDPGRYRDDAEAALWRERDPLQRVRLHLETTGAWDEDRQQAVEAAATDLVEEAVAAAEALEPLGPGDIFAATFAEATPALEAQRRRLERDG